MYYKIKAMENYLIQGLKQHRKLLSKRQDDNQLEWKEHVTSLSLNVSQAVGMIRYAKNSLPTKTLNCFIADWSNHA